MRLESSLFTALTIGACVSLGATQAQVTVVAPAPQVDGFRTVSGAVVLGDRLSAADVLSRLASFDHDGDKRLSIDELPERMQSIFKADRNGDRFLDAAELTKAVSDVAMTPQAGPFRPAKVVTIADVVGDMRLGQPRHDLVLELLKKYNVPRNVNIDLSEGEVLNGLRELLDDQEYEDLLAAVARIRNNGRQRVVGGVVQGLPNR